MNRPRDSFAAVLRASAPSRFALSAARTVIESKGDFVMDTPTPESAASNPIVRRPARPFPPRTEPVVWGKGRLKLDVILSDPDRTEYEALLADRKTSVQAAWAWLKARGYRVGYNAVCNHRRQLGYDAEQLRRAARAAAAYATAADAAGGPEAFSAAALTKINQLAMDRLFDEKVGAGAGGVTTAVLNELARTIDKALAARGRLEALRPKLAEARRAAEGQAEPDGVAIVNRVREMMGMPPIRNETENGT
jgi:hypothetical protein